jgi:iron complex outermembrane receptor protein
MFERSGRYAGVARGRWRLLCGAAVLAVAGLPAHAADTTPPADPTANAAPSANVQTADAAAPSGGGVETVMVTARRRSENAQNVPISLTAISPESLAANGITNSLKLNELIPSLQVISTNARNTNLIIRGLGSNIAIVNDGVEPGVGVYVDGVFYARPAETVFDLPDISSLEELRGPQGTLYGKNTVAGALNITTQAPSDTFEANGEVSVGNYDYVKVDGSVSGPLTSDGELLGRLTAFDTERSGWLYNSTTRSETDDYHDHGVRGQLLYKPTSNFSLRLIADYDNQKQLCCVSVPAAVVTTLNGGLPLPRNFYERAALAGYMLPTIDPFDYQTDANSPYHAYMEQGGVSAQADWLYDGFAFTSITAFRVLDWNPSNDSDATALSVLDQARQANQEKEFTQELRVQSPTDEPIEFTFGLFYYSEEDDGYGDTTYGSDAPIWILGASNPVTQAALNDFSLRSTSVPRTGSYAAYGQATWHILPQLDFTGGARFTYERKTGAYSQWQSGGADLSQLPPPEAAAALAIRNAFAPNAAYDVHVSNDLVGGLATLTYKFTDDINAYATYSHGSKSAGLNLVNIPVVPGASAIVKPEQIDNYEVGVKSTLFSDHLVLNGDVFWDNDTDYQTTVLLGQPTPITLAANIPSVRSRGLEADARANPLDGLETHLSLTYTDAIYVQYPNAPCPLESCISVVNGVPTFNPNATANLSGAALPAVSKWVATFGSEYDRPLGSMWSDDLTGYIGGDISWRSSYNSGVSDSIYTRVPGYEITNLELGVRTDDGHWDLSIWTRNAFNTHYYVTAGPAAFNSGLITELLGDPQTFGATLRVSY